MIFEHILRFGFKIEELNFANMNDKSNILLKVKRKTIINQIVIKKENKRDFRFFLITFFFHF